VLIKRVIKTSKGDFTFEGNLSQEELDVIVTVGIGVLLEKGAMPLLGIEEGEESRLVIASGEAH
jgi:hypothetical protein